jgi:hypothetical protein
MGMDFHLVSRRTPPSPPSLLLPSTSLSPSLILTMYYREGIATTVIAVLGYWIVQDFPDSATFLTEEERARVVARLQADDQFSAAGEAFKWSNLLSSLKDWKTWCGESNFLS